MYHIMIERFEEPKSWTPSTTHHPPKKSSERKTSRFAAGCIRLPRDPKGEENDCKAQKAFRYQRIR